MEKIKVLLLAAILAVLLIIAFRPRPQVGRFVEIDAGSSLALDTVTGQWCMAAGKPPENSTTVIKPCRDLH
jgi:hypothetical protein